MTDLTPTIGAQETAVNSITFDSVNKIKPTEKPQIDPVKFAKPVPKLDDPLQRIKNISESFNINPVEEYIPEVFENVRLRQHFESTNPIEISELARSYNTRDYANPGSRSENHATFSPVEENGSQIGGYSVSPTSISTMQNIDEVKALQKEVGGELAKRVNFDMMQELRESVYNAKFELDKVSGVKDDAINELEESLSKAMKILDEERKDLVIHTLEQILGEIKLDDLKLSELSPDNRTGYHQAVRNLECARDLVTKAGFGSTKGLNETTVIDLIVRSMDLYPEIKNNPRLEVMTQRVFVL